MQVAGPGLGGLLVAVVSAAMGAARRRRVSFLVSALCLWRMRPAHAWRPGRPPPAREPLRTRGRATGIDYVRHDRFLRFFTVHGRRRATSALTGYAALLVLFLVRDLGLDPARRRRSSWRSGSLGGVVGAGIARAGLAPARVDARAMVALQVLGRPAGPARRRSAQPGLGGRAWCRSGCCWSGSGVVAGNVIRGAWRNRYVPAHMVARR